MPVAVVVLAAIIALLYFWLVGHWFARVLVFLIFVLAGLFAPGIPNANPFALMAGYPLVGWFIAGAPTYFYRWQARRNAGEAPRLEIVSFLLKP